jgi:putative redox protein
MEFQVRLAGGDRVVVSTGEHEVVTDQDGSAPNPFTLFLASVGACAGYYVARFCRQRGIPTEGVRIRQTHVRNEAEHRIGSIELTLELPPGFPPRYREAALRAAHTCTVKRHLEEPPSIRLALAAEVPEEASAPAARH